MNELHQKIQAPQGARPIPLLITVAVGVGLWWLPVPEGLDVQAWHMMAIFVATIVGILTKPLPMGAVALIGTTATILAGILDFETAFFNYSSNVR